MCGIFGIFDFDNEDVSHEKLKLMSRNMIHRGPDDEGFFIDGSIGIGMRRLSIIDIEGGKQPICNEDGNIQVVFNGEIYNYIELRKQLIDQGYKFKTNSDTEVLVHLYENMGRKCINQLNGMFAFALWDKRKQILWIARDRLGIKPLFWNISSKKFHFSSDLNSLNKVVKSKISPKSLIRYLGYSYIPAPLSIFEDIHKLLPGHELIIKEGKLTDNRYWSLLKKKNRVSAEKASKKLNSLLSESTRLQLQSDVPVGILLSGGIDSSAIAVYAAAHLKGKSIRTYTADFMEKQGLDSFHARELAKSIGAIHTEVKISSDDQIKILDSLINEMDEPIADNAIVATYALAKKASMDGVKVLLSGAGGDEVFGGYDHHFKGKKYSSSWFANLPSFLRVILKPIWIIYNPALLYKLHNPSREFFTSTSGSNLWMLSRIIQNKSLFKGLIKDFDSKSGNLNDFDSYSRMKLDLKNYLPDNILALTDKATMAASVEGRVPLLDHRIVEYCFSLPQDLNILDGVPKGLFKKTLELKLTSKLIKRKKEGFSAPTSKWINNMAKHIHKELIHNTAPMLKEILNINNIDSWLKSDKLKQQGAETLYSLYILNSWLNSHCE